MTDKRVIGMVARLQEFYQNKDLRSIMGRAGDNWIEAFFARYIFHIGTGALRNGLRNREPRV